MAIIRKLSYQDGHPVFYLYNGLNLSDDEKIIMDNMENWLNDNILGNWSLRNYRTALYLYNEDDVLLFKLTWS